MEGDLRGAVVKEETTCSSCCSEGGEEDAIDRSEVGPRRREAAAVEEKHAGVERVTVERSGIHPYDTGVRAAVDEVAEAVEERRDFLRLLFVDGVQTEVAGESYLQVRTEMDEMQGMGTGRRAVIECKHEREM